MIPVSESSSPTSALDAQGVRTDIYPREKIPKQPVLSFATFTHYSNSTSPSVLDAGAVRYVNRGSMAIGLSLQHAKVGNGDEVLLPAYHCISMIEPVIWRGARPVFYRINPDTSINLSDIESRLTSRTRLLLVTHYFGFPQDMVRIRNFCDAHRILLIEDCAHAFFGAINGAPIGSFGDYAIASPWKFFPISDGGLIISARRDLSGLELLTPGPWFQAKTLVNTMEHAFEYRRLAAAHLLLKAPLWFKNQALRQTKGMVPVIAPSDAGSSSNLGNGGFDAARVNNRMSMSSWLITNMASKHRIVEKRRHNYARLLAELGNLPDCRPLFASLPEGVVPQVFPLVYDVPVRAFSLLKRAGVPIIRFGEYLWEDMDSSTCPVTAELSRCVFQFPCHQELRDNELHWMITQIRSLGKR